MKRFDDKKKSFSVPMTFVVSAIIAGFILIILSLVCSFFIIYELLPENCISVVGAVSCFIASCVSAYLSSKALGKIMLTSLVQAIANVALSYIAGVLIFMRIVPQNLNLIIFLAFVFGSVLGGFFAAIIRPRRHKIK